MSQASEAIERAEHAAHAAHAHPAHDEPAPKSGEAHPQPPKAARMMGLTIAMLGVLLAFCAALVGSARTDLIKTMVEQADSQNDYQAESTRYRTTLAQVEALDSLSPVDGPEATKDLKAISEAVSADHADIANALRAATIAQINAVAPDTDTVARLIRLTRMYQASSAAARAWTNSHDPVIRAQYEAAEGLERAQLCAEIAIVLASIALLLFNRAVWFASIGVGVIGIVLCGVTYTHLKGELREGEAKVEEAKKRYEELGHQGQDKEDEDVLRTIEKAYDLAPTGKNQPEAK